MFVGFKAWSDDTKKNLRCKASKMKCTEENLFTNHDKQGKGLDRLDMEVSSPVNIFFVKKDRS